MISLIRRCWVLQYSSPMAIIPVVCVSGDRFNSAAPGGSILVTCTESRRVINVSIVPKYEAARPNSSPIEVIVCLVVRYLKATHLAIFFK